MREEHSGRVGASGVAPRLWILAAAALFSTGGAAVKGTDLAPIQVACVRSGIAVLALLVLVPATRRRPRSGRSLLVALAFAATMLLFVLSSRATTAANAVFLQSTAPLYVLLLAPLLLAERLERGQLTALAGMAVGLALFLAAPEQARASAPRPVLGNVLAAISGATWGLSILGLRWAGRRGASTLEVVVAGNLLCCLVALPFAFPIAGVGLRDVLTLGWLGVFQIGVAYLCVARGIGGLSAFEASLLFLVEPVLSPVWAFLLHGERPGPLALAGGALIVGCALRIALRARGQST